MEKDKTRVSGKEGFFLKLKAAERRIRGGRVGKKGADELGDAGDVGEGRDVTRGRKGTRPGGRTKAAFVGKKMKLRGDRRVGSGSWAKSGSRTGGEEPSYEGKI